MNGGGTEEGDAAGGGDWPSVAAAEDKAVAELRLMEKFVLLLGCDKAIFVCVRSFCIFWRMTANQLMGIARTFSPFWSGLFRMELLLGRSPSFGCAHPKIGEPHTFWEWVDCLLTTKPGAANGRLPRNAHLCSFCVREKRGNDCAEASVPPAVRGRLTRSTNWHRKA